MLKEVHTREKDRRVSPWEKTTILELVAAAAAGGQCIYAPLRRSVYFRRAYAPTAGIVIHVAPPATQPPSRRIDVEQAWGTAFSLLVDPFAWVEGT